MRYERTSRLLQQLHLAQADGSYAKLLASLARLPLLILDDWLRDPPTTAQARDVLEILDDRYGRTSTLIATQIPVTAWHARIPDSNQSNCHRSGSVIPPILCWGVRSPLSA